jgi:hypothetical protein
MLEEVSNAARRFRVTTSTNPLVASALTGDLARLPEIEARAAHPCNGSPSGGVPRAEGLSSSCFVRIAHPAANCLRGEMVAGTNDRAWHQTGPVKCD